MDFKTYFKRQLVLASLTVAIASIIIAVKSLRLTQKSVESANRPYLVISLESIQVTSSIVDYLVLRNYGKSGAIIDSITLDLDYEGLKNQPFTSLENFSIAPGQSIPTAMTYTQSTDSYQRDRVFRLKYHNEQKCYEESFIVGSNQLKFMAFSKPKPSKNTKLEEIISKTAAEMLRRNL